MGFNSAFKGLNKPRNDPEERSYHFSGLRSSLFFGTNDCHV